MTTKDVLDKLKKVQRYTTYVASDGCKCCDSYVANEPDSMYGDYMMSSEIEDIIDDIEDSLEPRSVPAGLVGDDGALENE